MSEEQLKAFLEKVKADTSLQEKLKAAADSDAVLAIAKDAGFLIYAEDLKNAQSEISEEELEGVAGGECIGGGRGRCSFVSPQSERGGVGDEK
ncbi:Nif11-like leader peptide family natural product precursor [Synechococcus sp. MIT S9509]|uniref:Nif11-like leader peptide family natural product precursor n=1 Tax=Synechococcus sp. MIT S9509 TaxID=1801630 RepID=UPI00094182BE|nr:Nif11-like leader peptide family natural product precursor [Synechococcus sp. MIT S9509]